MLFMASHREQMAVQVRQAAAHVNAFLEDQSRTIGMHYLYQQRWRLVQSILSEICSASRVNIIMGYIRYLLWEFAQVLERAPQRTGLSDYPAENFDVCSDAVFGPAWVHQLTQAELPPEGAVPNQHGLGWVLVPDTPGLPSGRPSPYARNETVRPQRSLEHGHLSRSMAPRRARPVGPAPALPRYGLATNAGPLPMEGPRLVPAGLTSCLTQAKQHLSDHLRTLIAHSTEWARWQVIWRILHEIAITGGDVAELLYHVQRALWGYSGLLEWLLASAQPSRSAAHPPLL